MTRHIFLIIITDFGGSFRSLRTKNHFWFGNQMTITSSNEIRKLPKVL